MLARLFQLLAFLALPALAVAQSVPDPSLSSFVMHGTVGNRQVGLNYTVRNHTEFVTAHYYFRMQLKDIPLTGTVQGQDVELKGEDGSAFHLHFIGNGSNGSDPLTFYNSIGLSGTWEHGQQVLPVSLTGDYSIANPGERIYAQVTSRSDTEFEATVQAAYWAIVNGNPRRAALYVHFPLTVNLPHAHLKIQNTAQLQSNWPRIFPPPLVRKLRQYIPHELFIRNGMAGLGNVQLWFDDQGLATVNSF